MDERGDLGDYLVFFRIGVFLSLGQSVYIPTKATCDLLECMVFKTNHDYHKML